MASKKGSGVTGKMVNKVNNTFRNAGKKKIDNTIDGNKPTPTAKRWKADKTTPKTFSSSQKMKKPSK